MSQFKSEFFNLMVERGFTINAPTKQALTPICTSAKKAENLRSVIWAPTRPATVCTSATSFP